jgi:hypothetical protein
MTRPHAAVIAQLNGPYLPGTPRHAGPAAARVLKHSPVPACQGMPTAHANKEAPLKWDSAPR